MRFRLFALLCAMAVLCPCMWAQPPAGFVAVTAARLVDLTGVPVSGQLTAQILVNGRPVGAGSGAGGQIAVSQVTASIVNGAVTINLPDTHLSHPQNVCIALSAEDANGLPLFGPGYSCVQPTSVPNYWCSASGCNLDLYIPSTAAVAPVATGPAGPTGPAGCVVGQTCVQVGGVLVNQFPTLAAAAATCPTDGTVCDLVTYAPIAVTSTTLPARAVPRFVGPGQWVSGGAGTVVAVPSGQVVAVAGQQVFNGVGITGLSEAMPDWFGYYPVAAEPSYPATAVDAAYSATVAGGTIRLSKRNYLLSGTPICGARVWQGAGRPVPDSITATRFVTGSGTVLQGTFANVCSGVTVRDLGVDNGTWVTANKFGGTFRGIGGLVQSMGAPRAAPSRDVRWQNVSVVMQSGPGRHGALFENVDGGSVDGIWIYVPAASPGAAANSNGWGFVEKSQNSSLTNIWVYGANDAAVYSRSNSNGDVNGHSGNNVWRNVHIAQTHQLDAGPWLIEGSGDSNANSQVDGVYFDSASAGIKDNTTTVGGVAGYVGEWRIRGVYGTSMYGPCIYLGAADRFVLDGITCDSKTFSALGTVYFYGAAVNNYLRDVTMSFSGSGSGTYGLSARAGAIATRAEHVVCIGTGYCLLQDSAGQLAVHNLTAAGVTQGSAPYYTYGSVTVTDF